MFPVGMTKYTSIAKIYTQMSLSVSHKILFCLSSSFPFTFFIHSDREHDYFIVVYMRCGVECKSCSKLYFRVVNIFLTHQKVQIVSFCLKLLTFSLYDDLNKSGREIVSLFGKHIHIINIPV